jgi:hypothetical protein
MNNKIAKIACKYCKNILHIRKVASEPSEEYRNFNEGFYGTDPHWDGTLDPKKDRGNWPRYYLDKQKKNFPGKKDIDTPLEDDVSPSTLAGFVDNRMLYAYCDKCHKENVAFLNNKKIAVQPDPNYMDDNHYNPEDHFDNYPVNKNEPANNKRNKMYGTDHNRVTSTPDVVDESDKKMTILKQH